MLINAIAPWFGSKRNLAPAIIAALGPHRAYWEPFCGSLAVLLAKPPASFETVNDLHGMLINLARVLKEESTARELYRRLSGLLVHEQLFTEAAERYRKRGNQPAADIMRDIDAAEDFMVCSWFGRNGVAGTQNYNQGFCVRYTKSGGHSATRWVSAVDSIPDWHLRLRHVTILNRNAFDILERIEDAPETAIYCDPPYVEKGATYVHDFKSGDGGGGLFAAAPEADDHARLAALLSRFKQTRVVVSYYEHPRVTQLYANWHIERIVVSKALSNQQGDGYQSKATELLISNAKP